MPETAIDISELFEDLKADWKSKTRYMSNSAQMATVWPYQQIIGMGRPALPLILQELKRETDHWFWALEAISGENPVSAEQGWSSREHGEGLDRMGAATGTHLTCFPTRRSPA